MTDDQRFPRHDRTKPQEAWELQNALLRQWSERKRELEQTFLHEIESILTADEFARWQVLYQRFVRERLAAKCRNFDVRWAFDLSEILRELNIDSNHANLSGIVADYQREYEQSLLNFLSTYEEVVQGLAFAATPREIRDLRAELETARYGVAQVNRRYLEILANSVADEDRNRVRDGYAHLVYPAVFRTAPAELAFAAIENVHLDPKTTARINELKAGYAPEQARLRRQIVAEWEAWDTLAQRIHLLDTIPPGTDPRVEIPACPTWLAIRQLNLTTIRQIVACLKDANITLPIELQFLSDWTIQAR